MTSHPHHDLKATNNTMSLDRKGIVLAGGLGTRLRPLTTAVSKQLLPVYDRPMIYYPISTLIEAGIRDILVICTPQHLDLFSLLLADGSELGVRISYATQEQPKGLAQALIIAEEFLQGSPSVLILGDNLFHCPDMKQKLQIASSRGGATVFLTKVQNPSRYGVAVVDEGFNVLEMVEKPEKFISDYAITGLYMFDENAPKLAKSLAPSERGELEIVDLLNCYLPQNLLVAEILDPEAKWFDMGTFESLFEASQFARLWKQRYEQDATTRKSLII